MEVSRRKFLQLTVVSTAGVALGDGGTQLGNVLQASEQEERVPNGVEQWLRTTCTLCPGGCGARVRLIDTRAVKLDGNPLHPVTRGGLCPVAEAALQLVYSPDRLTEPMLRVGGRGQGEWQPLSWERALQILADGLRSHRDKEGAETLLLVLGRSHGLAPELLRRFAHAYGTPEVLELTSGDPAADALWLTQGIRTTPAYDLENAHYVLSFGVPLVDGWHGPVRQMLALAEMRQATPGHRGKLVQLEARLSPTAAKADEWIPLAPGTEGALALGIAHVLVAEGFYNPAFVAERTFGFEDSTDAAGNRQPGFRSMVLEQYAPARVAQITGVSEETIRRLATEFARFGPALAIGPIGGHSNAVESALAVHALNALVGGIESVGGVLVPPVPVFPELPPVDPDPKAREGLASAQRSPGDALLPLNGRVANLAPWLERLSDVTKVLLLWDANPLFSDPEAKRCHEALEKIPLIATIAPFLDETAAFADLVLPESTFLESWDVLDSAPGLPDQLVGLAQPALAARGQAKSAGEIVLALARELGGSIGAAFPWESMEQVVRAKVDGLVRDAQGGVFPEAAAAQGNEAAATPDYESPDALWQDLLNRGGWSGRPREYGNWRRALQTRSGKYEFSSQNLRDAITAAVPREPMRALLKTFDADFTDPRLLLPHYSTPLPEDVDGFPLRLLLFRTLALGAGEHANQPFLQEIVAPHVNVQWDSWAELNPVTAASLQIADGDWIWLESPHGRIRVRAKLWPGIVPGAVALPLGQGHTAVGQYARGTGANPIALLSATRDPLSGAAVLSARVRVTRA